MRLVYDERYFRDVDPGNDTAAIRVNRGGGGGGGALPITGPGGAWIGAALVVVGALLKLAGRRRIRPASAGRGR